MKRSYIKQMLIVLCSILAFASCQIEPDFPLPGFTTGDREVTFRRDTVMYSYEITFGMELINGVSEITLSDGYTNEFIDNIYGYEGEKNFTLSYVEDLTPISLDVDTTLYRAFRIVDSKGGIFNRTCKLIIKKLSQPEVIGLTDGSTVSIQGPIYSPQGTAGTGMIPMASVEYLFADESRYKIEFTDTLVYEYKLNKGVSLNDDNLEEGNLYPFSIIVRDTEGRENTTTVNLKLTPAKMPSKVLWNNAGNTHELQFITDENNRISQVVLYTFYASNPGNNKIYNHVLTYDENDNVTSFKLEGDTRYDNFYTYDVDGKLSGVTCNNNNKPRQLSNFKYNEDGIMQSYYDGSTQVNYPLYTDPLGINLYLFSLYTGRYGISATTDYAQITSFNSVFMPTYIEGLPPFFAFTSSRQLPFVDLLTNMLIPDELSPSSLIMSSLPTSGKFTYEMNDDGTIHKIYVRYLTGSLSTGTSATNSYEFVY